MSKHTQGPWHVVHNSWEISTVYDCDDRVVAEMPIDSRVDEDSQATYEPIKDANASLIAAVPELLEAYQELLGLAEREGWIHVAINKARAAIAKATGEQP